MQEQLISFETAKLAKEKGFNFKVPLYFSINIISPGKPLRHIPSCFPSRS